MPFTNKRIDLYVLINLSQLTMKNYSILLSIFFFLVVSCSRPSTETVKFYLGTSDTNLSYPIKLCELNIENTSISILDSFAGSIASSYICFSPDENFLFAGSRPSGDENGQINSYSKDKNTLQLKLQNSQDSKGIGPAHLSVHPNGKTVFAANYSSGTVASLPIDENGKVDPANSFFEHEGTGPVESRQTSPHAHFISADPSGKYVLSVDLGADKVFIYSYNNTSGEILPNENQPYLEIEAGAGPRHLVFHPSGKWFYVINELNSTLSFCVFNSATGEAELIKSISTLPKNIEVENYPAAVRIHANGKFLYCSNRGGNSIALFSVNSNGMPTLVETKSTEGDWPRDFNIDPTGKFLIVANQGSNNLTAFKIDQENGTLESMNLSTETSEPTCVLFIDENEK